MTTVQPLKRKNDLCHENYDFARGILLCLSTCNLDQRHNRISSNNVRA